MANQFIVETSARHVHVTQETLELLFGEGYQLTVKKELSQPGQFASNERITVVGPKKELANVSILGPCRKLNQVELSATDARSIGIDAPIRESGDVAGSGACKLIGPKGEVELKEGVRMSEDEVNQLCFDLPRYKRPKKIIFAKVLRNATGKIEKPKLREIYSKVSLVEAETTS